MAKQQGWTISQVEALIGLSRRDIQRCCYEGKGGVGILSPEDSKWGRRTYSAEDLARLFIVAQLKASGLSLPEAKRELDRNEANGQSDSDLLQNFADRTAEKIEELQTLLMSARALLLAQEDPTDEKLSALIDERIPSNVVKSLLAEEEMSSAMNVSQSMNFLQALDDPGVAIAIELAFGPGSVENIRNRLVSQKTR